MIKPKNEERVLVVEDDRELRAYLSNSLKKIYYVGQKDLLIFLLSISSAYLSILHIYYI